MFWGLGESAWKQFISFVPFSYGKELNPNFPNVGLEAPLKFCSLNTALTPQGAPLKNPRKAFSLPNCSLISLTAILSGMELI